MSGKMLKEMSREEFRELVEEVVDKRVNKLFPPLAVENNIKSTKRRMRHKEEGEEGEFSIVDLIREEEWSKRIGYSLFRRSWPPEAAKRWAEYWRPFDY